MIKMLLNCRSKGLLRFLSFLALMSAWFGHPVGAGEPAGASIYNKKCAECHGKQGEGSKVYAHPLVGNRSLPQLAKYVLRYMPEDDPGTLTREDADKVSAYVFDAFYSPEAQARIKPTRVERSRLTVNEYRYAIADLLGSYSAAPNSVRPIKADQDAHGLRGEYFAGGTGGKRGRNFVFARIDPQVHFDFLASAPDFDKLSTPEIAANWQGAVLAPETGLYEFVVRTEHATKLWVNDMRKPLIDRSVKSGTDTEFRAPIYLLAGRAYPVRLEFSRGNVGVRKDPKDKLKTEKTTMELAWKLPLGSVTTTIPVRNLLPVDVGTSFALSLKLPPDDRSAGYERGTAVSKEWVQATTDGAIEAAEFLGAHLAELSGVKIDSPKRQEKLQEFSAKFVERAFRRPLSPEQKKLYVERQFESAKDPESAIKRVVLLTLQSPRFLYRESATPALEASTDALDVASRLSFGLWDTIPDDTLVRAAASGRLQSREDVVRETERMLTDRKAKTKLRAFFLQWLKVDQVAELSKDPKHFPEFDDHVANDLRSSLELFLEDTFWSKSSDYRQLILADYLFLNGRLAKLYGNDLKTDAVFEKLASKSQDRSGILTHPYLLANLSYPDASSPIHRGVFLARNVLGVTLRQPPDAFTPLPADLHPNLTTRERITLQTSPKDCKSCHGVINPLGFTLENYDAIGRFRSTDNKKPIDSTGAFVTRSGETVQFKNARQLAQFVANSDEAHEAFVARLFHHLVRQPVLAYGPTKLDELRRSFVSRDFNMKQLVVEILAQTALPNPARMK